MAFGFRRNKMKKKLLCLLIALVMVAACFAGCGAKDDQEAVDDINEEASASAMTLVMYLMSEEEVSEDQANAVEAAVNKITKSKFKTQLDLRFYTPDEYYVALEAAFAARKDAEEQGLIVAPVEEESTEEETYEDEWGVSQIKYPTVSDFQVDIFYLGGYAKYKQYMEMEMLQKLDEELSSSSKKLNSYISTDFLTYMKSANGNGTYALPTNAAIGDYTYLLINKQALADMEYDTDAGLKDFTSFTADKVQQFLYDINKYDNKYDKLIYSDLSQIELASSGIYYWGIDEKGDLSTDFSVLASDVTAGAAYGDKTTSYLHMTRFNNTKFIDQLGVVKGYSKAYGAMGEQANYDAFVNGKVAMACIKGGAEIPQAFAENYEAVVVGAPTLNTMDLYENMFAVSTYTANTSRSMEILTYINTNEDIRNILQYGILDEDYQLVESDYKDAEGNPYMVVKMLENDDGGYDYVMDVNKTGNTLIAYNKVGENPTLKDFIKKQNIDAVASLTMGYRIDYKDMVIDMDALAKLRELSATALEKLNNCTADNYDATVKEICDALAEESCFSALLADIPPQSETDICGLYHSYTEWAVEKKIYERPAEDEAE